MNLFETLLAVAIMAVVFTVSSVALLPTLETSKVKATQLEIKSIKTASLLYHIREGRLPTDFRQLCRANLLNRCDEFDAFGNEYRLRDGAIRSAGVDGRYNTRDDIVSPL
jgi:type II secretory pathway pseudopilin PulG